MRRRVFAAFPLMTLATSVAIAACGGGSSSSSGGSTPTAAGPSSINVGGGSFCDKTRSVIAQIGQLSRSVTPSPGATPNVTSFKQLLATLTSAIDSLDSSAPSEISSDFHAFRAAYDQANTQAQTATTLQQLSSAFSAIDVPAVKSAGDHISSYLQTTCGINPSASP